MLIQLLILFCRELYPAADEAEIQSQTWRILSHLQAQSLLRVLHSVFGLKNVPAERIKSMLTYCQGIVIDINLEFSKLIEILSVVADLAVMTFLI